MEGSMKEWEKLVEGEFERKFGMISNTLGEVGLRNQRRAKRFHNHIIDLFASTYVPDEVFKKQMVDSVIDDGLGTLKVYKEELIQTSNFIPREKYHLKLSQKLERRKKDTLPQQIIWISDLTTYFNGVSGEARLSYRVLTGEKLSTVIEELLPYLINAASYLFSGKELKRDKEIGMYWPEIAFFLIDSQSHPDSVVTNALFIENSSGNLDVAKYLLQNTPTQGYALTTIYPPSKHLLSHVRKRVEKFKNVPGGRCELPTLSKKLYLPYFREYATSLIYHIFSRKLKGENVKSYMEELKNRARIDSDFLPTFYQIEKRIEAISRMIS